MSKISDVRLMLGFTVTCINTKPHQSNTRELEKASQTSGTASNKTGEECRVRAGR